MFIDNENETNIRKFDNTSLYEDKEKGFDLTEESINKYKFLWSQFYLEPKTNTELLAEARRNEIKRLVKFIRKFYEKLDDDSLLMVVFTGRCIDKNQELNSETNDMFKGRCLLKYKCNQLDELNEEIKKIYSEVNLVTSSII